MKTICALCFFAAYLTARCVPTAPHPHATAWLAATFSLLASLAFSAVVIDGMRGQRA